MEKPKLIRYLKDKYDRRCGVVVALDRDKIGWSLCKLPSPFIIQEAKRDIYSYDPYYDHDRWDKEKGLKIAIGRAKTGVAWDYRLRKENDLHKSSKVESILIPALKQMKERAEKYFKVVN